MTWAGSVPRIPYPFTPSAPTNVGAGTVGRQRSFSFAMVVNHASIRTDDVTRYIGCCGLHLRADPQGGGVWHVRVENRFGTPVVVNNWQPQVGVGYLFVVSYNRDSGVRLVRVGAVLHTTIVGPRPGVDPDTEVTLGMNGTALANQYGARFHGTISNVRFWDRALTEEEMWMVDPIASSNTSTPVLWINEAVNGVTYKRPLYQ